MNLLTKERFEEIANQYKEETCGDFTPNGIYREISYHDNTVIAINRQKKDENDNQFFYLTVCFGGWDHDCDDTDLVICNGVDASGYDYVLKNPTEEVLIKLLKDINEGPGWSFNQGYLKALCGDYVSCF